MSTNRGRRPDVVGLIVAIGVALVLLVLAWPRVSAPFGDSDEGINAAVWATNSRALREDGVVESRLGGRRLDGTSYATHPPFIVVATATAETLAGEREWASRAPAWLASLAAAGLLYALARSVGVGPPAAAAASAATVLTPMYFTYAFMLDTPVVSLPFGIAVLLLWSRRWQLPDGQRATPSVITAVACAAAAMAGWQAAVLVALAAITLIGRGVRGRKSWLGEAAPFVVGGAAGVVLSLGWTWWVYGDFATLGDKYFRRSGDSNTVGLDDMLSFQIPWLVQLLGVGIAGLGAGVAALWDRRARPLAAMSLGIVVLYAVVFRQAAAGHQYWNYWALIPTAVGFAWVFDRLARDLPSRAVVPTFLVGCLAIGIVNLTVLDDEALRYIDDGREVAELVVEAERPAGQTTAPYVGPAYRPDAWLRYYTGLAPRQLATTDDLRALAAEEPDTVVVVLGWCQRPDAGLALCREVVGPDAATDGDYVAPDPEVVTARELAGRGVP